MARLIDADALKESIRWCQEQGSSYDTYWDDILERIDAQPTIDAEPVRRGKWIEICDTRDWQYTDEHYVCSGCLKTSAYKSDYCPKCGARMTEDAGVH